MDIGTLKTLVKAGLTDGKYSLGIASLQSADLNTLATKFIANDKLNLTPGETPFKETENSITVVGTGIDAPFTDMAVEAEFYLDTGKNAALTLSAKGGAEYRFDQSFAVFKGNLGAELPFKGTPVIWLLSGAQNPHPAGMSFEGTLDFAQLSNGIATLLGITSEDLSGTMDMQGGGKTLTKFALDGPPLANIDLFIAKDVAVTFGLNAYHIQAPAATHPTLIPYIALGADIPFTAGGKKHSLPLSVRASSFNAPIRFNADLTDVIDATLDELGGLVGGADLGSTLPPPSTLPVGKDVAFTSLYMDIAPDGSAVTDVGLRVESAAVWDVVKIESTGRTLTAKDVYLDFLVVAPFSDPSPYLRFGGTFSITPKADLVMAAQLPDMQIGGYLTEGSVLTLSDFVEEFVGPVQGLPSIEVREISFFASKANYQFSVAVGGYWAINTDANFGLIVNGLGFEISYQGGDVQANLTGMFQIASIPLTVSAAYVSDDGWTFTGRTEPGAEIAIGKFITYVAETFTVPEPPKWVQQTTLKDVATSFKPSKMNFSFTVTGVIPIGGAEPLEITLGFSLESVNGGYRKHVSGELDVAGQIFTLDVEGSPTDMSVTGAWRAASPDHYLEFSTIAHAFAPASDIPELPNGLKLSIKEIALTYDFTLKSLTLSMSSATYGNAAFVALHDEQAGKWIFYFGLAIDRPLSLSNLPVLDHVLSGDETIEVSAFQALVASSPLDPNDAAQKAEIEAINAKIPQGYPTIPAPGLPGQVAVSADFNFGGDIYPLSIGTPAAANAVTSPSKGSAGTGSGPNKGTVPPPGDAADGTTWFNVQKSFGPVNFEKVGVRYSDSILWFLLDASMTAAGLSIAVEGLSVGSPLTDFEPHFNIEGLGIEYSGPSFSIGGAFLNLPPEAPITLEFGGMLTVEASVYGATAMGGYAQFDGQTSMFVFLNVDAVIGGPPYFMIAGFCGGFGYNNLLRIPAQDEVYQFPFVASMKDEGVFGKNPTPLSVLKKMMAGNDPWVRPSAGDFWLALGIKFTTFEVVNSTALVIGEFGNRFLLALIGLSKARFPMAGPETYAYVELQLEAVFDPTDGFFSVSAVLSPNSYLLDPNVKLTGGFAFEVWYPPNEHSGDFVVTVGGYSPFFDVPDHYPQEQPVGFKWSIDNTVSIEGGLYFAMTPAAMMAGGTLSVNYQSGNLKAWFDAHAHIIAWYNPFHFVADIGVSIGASYKVDLLFGSKTYKVELGADLQMWGPETGGTVTVHWFIISFTVDFGAGKSDTPLRQDWTTFANVLPTPDKVVSVVAARGLQAEPPKESSPQIEDRSGIDEPVEEALPWLVRADAFEFTADSKVPLTHLYIGDGADPFATGSQLNIKPMGAEDKTSRTTLKVISEATQENVLTADWPVEATRNAVPVALWGTGPNNELPEGNGLLPDQLAGFRIKLPQAKLGAGTGAINVRDDLQYDWLPPGPNPFKVGLPPVGPVPRQSDQAISNITHIMDQPVLDARDALHSTFAELGLSPVENGSLNDLAARAGELFVNEPLEIGDGQ